MSPGRRTAKEGDVNASRRTMESRACVLATGVGANAGEEGDECRRCRHRATVYCTIGVAFAAHGHRLRQKEGARRRERNGARGRGGGKIGDGKRGERWSNAGTRATHGARGKSEMKGGARGRKGRRQAGRVGERERSKEREREVGCDRARTRGA